MRHHSAMRFLSGLLLLAACAPAANSPSSSPDASSNAPPIGALERFATLPVSTEGIAFGRDAEGRDVLFLTGGNRVFKVLPDGTVSEHAAVPAALGLAVLPDGDLVVCGETGGTEEMPGALWRVTSAGVASVLLGPGSTVFQRTNFVAVAPDGSLLFSDSAADKVYRVNVDGSGLALVTEAISYPNGVAFSVDGSVAFVASWDERKVYSLAVQGDGTYGAPEVWLDDVETVDGIAVTESGDLVLVSTGLGVVRVGRQDRVVTTLADAASFTVAANGAFGSAPFGTRWLYVTDLFRPELVRVYVGEAGAPLPVAQR
ncbi:MAG: SMP-30/gluconolactonase/LRE family protein [Myxococcota bacterium]